MTRIFIKDLKNFADKAVAIMGRVVNLRKLGGLSFIIIEDFSGSIQTVWQNENEAKIGDIIQIEGQVKKDDRAKGGLEIQGVKINIISKNEIEWPFDLSQDKLDLSLAKLLDSRPLTLRHKKVRAIFKIYDVILKAYEEVMRKEGFTEIKTPKLLGALTEGGANFFKVKYFEKEAYLAQSPQFYKQIMVGVFERVFEIGPVFRAEPHFTTRHVNEYTSLDAEMGFIENETDVMAQLNNTLKLMFEKISTESKTELDYLDLSLDAVPEQIPQIKLSDLKKILLKKYKYQIPETIDIDPEGERLACRYALEEFKTNFLFVTHYPWKDRPFYTMPADQNQNESLGFDLLYKKMEIVTGSQRIHDYKMLAKNMKAKKINPKGMEFYIETFKSGMPPHGGWAIGSERLLQLIIGLDSVKEAVLFPRDVKRLNP